jgi:hypothetical protein
MGFTRAGSTNEHRVLRHVGKRQRCQLFNQWLIDLGRGEIKSRQIAVYWELGCVFRGS